MRLLTGLSASGPIVRLDSPLSFWGGFNPETGRVIDANHPQCGISLTGALVAVPHGRGSSSSSSVLAESIRLGSAPAGIIVSELDEILLVGAIVANDLYQVGFPLAVGELPASSPETWRLDHAGLTRVG